MTVRGHLCGSYLKFAPHRCEAWRERPRSPAKKREGLARRPSSRTEGDGQRQKPRINGGITGPARPIAEPGRARARATRVRRRQIEHGEPARLRRLKEPPEPRHRSRDYAAARATAGSTIR